jgi:ornithine cyclodeaminase/alanine dehydrogenase-like protein (mu-crystallin family)
VLQGSWLENGTTVIAVGANDPAARELDDDVIGRAAFVCTDSREQARQEAGDLIATTRNWSDVHELHQIVTGEVRGRRGDDDIVVFKSNGLAAWDLAAAATVVAKARDAR